MCMLTKYSCFYRFLPPTVYTAVLSKIADLRTLNTLHSEKLLAFKMEELSEPMMKKEPDFSKRSESPSADSGIESGACSSPARSDETHHDNEEMPVLKRALQAPPLNACSEGSSEFRPHKKFRYVIFT